MRRFFICFSIITLIFLAAPFKGNHTPISVVSHVIEEMQGIQKVEVLYSLTRGQGRFADLRILANAGYIDPALASGEKYGYSFEITLSGQAATMFDLTAKPKLFESTDGLHSFYSNERLILYEASGPEPPFAGLSDRVPKTGSPIGGLTP